MTPCSVRRAVIEGTTAGLCGGVEREDRVQQREAALSHSNLLKRRQELVEGDHCRYFCAFQCKPSLQI